MAGSHITIFTHNNIHFNINGINETSPNQNTETGKFDEKSKPMGVLYPKNPSHMQGYI